jgi:hypothetical protein
MKTLYAACLSRLGLSLAEAAALHDVGLPTVKHWSAGRRPVPQGVWDDLRRYEAQIVDGSDKLLDAWEGAGRPPIEIDDSEADGIAVMAAADFLLSTPEGAPVSVGRTPATETAKQARRLN